MTARRLDIWKVLAVLISGAAVCITMAIQGSKVVSIITNHTDAIADLKDKADKLATAQAQTRALQAADHDKIIEHDQIIKYLTNKPQPKRDYYSAIVRDSTHSYTLK